MQKYRNFVGCCKVIFKSFHIMESVKGYVYILTNPSFREDWVKIGKSSRLFWHYENPDKTNGASKYLETAIILPEITLRHK